MLHYAVQNFLFAVVSQQISIDNYAKDGSLTGLNLSACQLWMLVFELSKGGSK